MYSFLTTLTVCVHFAFLLFVVGGGLLARRYRWLVLPQLAAAVWGVYVEAMPGLHCPLTVLENVLAAHAGAVGYSNSFVEHYLLPVLYPEGLTRGMQWALAGVVLVANVLVYAWPRRELRVGTPSN
jgi:Protein of Unknown function (DUF2784)